MFKAVLGSLLLWPVHIASFIGLGVLGLLAIPIAAIRGAVYERASKKYRYDTEASHVTTAALSKTVVPHYIKAFKWAWLDYIWGNEEDGTDGAAWYRQANKSFSTVRRIIQWSALRNPVNNVRFNLPAPFGGVSLKTNGRRVVGNSETPSNELRHPDFKNRRVFWHFTAQEGFAGFWLIYKINDSRHFRFRLGWKIPVGDIPPTDYRSAGVGFAIQFTPYRKG